MAALSVNGKTHQIDVDPSTPLLWVLREQVGLTGTKYGCGIAQCGSCTVHVDGVAMRSCSVPVSAVEGKQVITIEGLAQNGVLHKRNPMASGKRCNAGSMGFWRAGLRAIRPEGSSMIRALADLLAHLFSDFGV